MSFAFVFPGQGSQSIGMLAALSQTDPIIRATFEEASAALGLRSGPIRGMPISIKHIRQFPGELSFG